MPRETSVLKDCEKRAFDKLLLHELGMNSIPASRLRELKLRKHDTVIIHHLTGAVEVYKVGSDKKISRDFEMDKRISISIEKAAWERFEKWCKRYREDHPETEDLNNYVSDYDLAMIYGKEGGAR